MSVENNESDLKLIVKLPDGTEQKLTIRFILDRSFFHDAFRTDYTGNESAIWLYDYMLHRGALDKRNRVCYVSSIVMDRLQNEFKSFPHLPSQTILAVKSFTEIQIMPNDIELDYSSLYLAQIIWKNGFVPLILSSVGFEKWKMRAQKAGIDMGLEEFSENMSDKRVIDKLWFAPISSHDCAMGLKQIDPLFWQIVDMIGQAPE